MRIIRADAATEREVGDWASTGVVMATLTEFAENDFVRVTRGTYIAGAILGRHPTGMWQAFAILEGDGWVAGDGGARVEVHAGDVVVWEPGEEHTSGSAHGMRVCIVQTTRNPRPQ
jgi:quercetin dioxygenase-like cupin family protein